MEPKESLSSQDNPKKKERSWKYHVNQLQTKLQGYGNQNNMMLSNMILVQKQTHRPTEQVREPRNKATHLQPSDL